MITRALREVFGNPAYMLLSGVVSFVAFSLAVWLPNARLLFTVAASEDASLFETLAFAFHLLLSITTNFTVLSATYTIAIALFNRRQHRMYHLCVQTAEKYGAENGSCRRILWCCERDSWCGMYRVRDSHSDIRPRNVRRRGRTCISASSRW